jgi:hypothetical protein
MNARIYTGYDCRRTEARVRADIIDIAAYRRPAPRRVRRKSGAGGTFWNTVFIMLCLTAAGIVLFLH